MWNKNEGSYILMNLEEIFTSSSFTKSFMTAQNSIFSSLRNRTTPLFQKAVYEVIQWLLDIGIQNCILNKGLLLCHPCIINYLIE